MWSVNMQHFLDENGSTAQVPARAKELADHFGAIVAAVTLDFTGRAIEVSGVTCRNPKPPDCPGSIIGYLGRDLHSIEWYCTDCEDSGVITGWDDTLWDCTEEALAGL
ncbi:MAG: hypothetical protein NUV80_06335 [Candidatus Berkelbacteria bacterium]|nr:hypothetical protein [Candidatus Berkelbacteria bacterium]